MTNAYATPVADSDLEQDPFLPPGEDPDDGESDDSEPNPDESEPDS